MTAPARPFLTAHLRWMVRRDLPEVLAADAASFGPLAWPEGVFLERLRRRNVIGLAAEVGPAVAGYAVYELRPTSLRVLRAAVAPGYRRGGVGRQLLAKLAGKVSVYHRRSHAMFAVRESNLAAHRWLSACGWRAVRVDRGRFDDPEEDGYVFRFDPHPESLP